MANVQLVTQILHARLVFQVIMEVVGQPAWLAQLLETDTVRVVTQSAIAQFANQDTQEPYAMTAFLLIIYQAPIA